MTASFLGRRLMQISRVAAIQLVFQSLDETQIFTQVNKKRLLLAFDGGVHFI
jgi:hypothetical protein